MSQEHIDTDILKAPDEFTVVGRTLIDWVQQHQALVIGAAAAMLVAAIGAGVVSSQRTRAVDAAAVSFRTAHKQFAQDKFADAATAFGRAAADGSGTPFGHLAALYRGHALRRQGDNAAAVTAYQEFLAAGPSDELLRQQALVGLATAQESAGNGEAAMRSYEDARKLSGPYTTDAALGVARLNEAQGRAESAREIYTELLTDSNLDPGLRATLQARVPGAATPVEKPAGQ